MDVGRQKLRKNCDFYPSKTEEKLRLYLVNRNPDTRNGRWTSKTEEKLRFDFFNRNLYARNGRWTSKTEAKMRWTLCV